MSDQASKSPDDDHVVLGRLTSSYGIKGWLKVYSYTDPMVGILDYPDWVLRIGDRLERRRLAQGRPHGKGLVASLEGVDSREAADALAGAEVLLPKAELPDLDGDDVYWYQLEGLRVLTGEGVDLGRISHLFETGANDVMVVRDETGRERLLPYLPGEVILETDLTGGRLVVDWDPDF